MPILTSFTFISLNGFFKGANGDIGWHVHGTEENEYAADSLGHGHALVFGRVTYDMMAGYWPSEMAAKNDPTVAKGMNDAEKIVFSRTMKRAAWRNTRVVSGDIVAEMRRLKRGPGKDMTILGSGSIVTLFASHGLIDEFGIMVDPVALASGTPIFDGLDGKLVLRLIATRSFTSGAVLLRYAPVASA